MDSSLSWAAGLFEGEGSAILVTRRHRCVDGVETVHSYPKLQMGSSDEDVIRRFRGIVGGCVSGPYVSKKHPTRRPMWQWQYSGPGARALAVKMLPLLGARRRARVCEVFGLEVMR